MNTALRLSFVGLVMFVAAISAAAAQSLEALRSARESAKADLIRAQDAFIRADEDYIEALSGASSKKAPAPTASPPAPQSAPAASRPIEVTFTMNGTGALQASPFDYRARIIPDGRPADWTEHASGAKQTAPPATRNLAYEVQRDAKADPTSPAWSTICQGMLALKPKSTVEVVIDREARCALK